MTRKTFLTVLCLLFWLAACTIPKAEVTPTSAPPQTNPPGITPTTNPYLQINAVDYSLEKPENGLFLDQGGDVDSEVVSFGDPVQQGMRTGNGSALTSPDRNSTPDSYLQFQVDDRFLFQGKPATRVQIEVAYYDVGTDNFSIEYDALAGVFTSTGVVAKTDSGTIKTAAFPLCDAYFANRDNGADFRISDWGDGAETILSVRVTRLAQTPGPATIFVDRCGAN